MTGKFDSTPEGVQITLKERQVLELRLGGVKFSDIAEALDYANAGGAYKAFARAMRKTLQEPADELRRLECARLDTLLQSMWGKALDGSTWHVDRCLAIMDRRAKLLGLDAPTRKVVNVVTEDVIDAEIRKLEAELAANDPDPAGMGDPGQSGEAGLSR